MPARVLILFAHPALEKSRVHRRLIEGLAEMEGVTFHDLYEFYPDLHIDVRREQELLVAHDVIVLQHPFYWYSCPAILKEWQDLVLEWGFAYGEGGTSLRGKTMLTVITTGGPEESYGRERLNRFTVRELLAPFEQTARLCGMDYPPPFVVHGTHGLSRLEIEGYAADYRRLIRRLCAGTVDLEMARDWPRLNADLHALLNEEEGAARA